MTMHQRAHNDLKGIDMVVAKCDGKERVLTFQGSYMCSACR